MGEREKLEMKKTYQPTSAEREVVQSLSDRKEREKLIPKLRGEMPELSPDHESHQIWLDLLQTTLGTSSNESAHTLLNQLAGLEGTALKINGDLALIHGIGPRDELEAMLVVQMVAIHKTAINCLRGAIQNTHPDIRHQNLNQGVKLTKAFTAQMEALNKHRGNGGQKVRVEHVHVYQGGQAVVGNIVKGGEG